MPSTAKLIATALLSAALGAGGYALYAKRMAGAGTHEPGTPVAAKPPASAGQGERRILYWYDPMVPQQRFDKPGKSPFMDMQLVPKYADEGTAPDAGGTVSIDPRVMQSMGVRLAAAEKGSLAAEFDALGIVRLDETRTEVVQTRVAGYVEHQPVRSLNQPVARGQVLLELTSPELIATQHELLLALKANDASLAAAARERLRLADMSQAQIERVERTGEVLQRVAVTAPESGIVTELNARPGMTVAAGAPLMTLASLATVWVMADIPERDAARVAFGRGAEVRFEALPGQVLKGKVEYVYPEIAGAARTVRARIPLANVQGKLKPGMLANISFSGGMRAERVLVPSEAVIQTGTRSVVIVSQAPGKFAAIDVKLGHERGGKAEVLEGIEAGQKVVVSGQFLIDSEASLQSALARLEGVETSPAPGSAAGSLAQGKVNAVNARAATINLSHGPVSSVGMPGMTMEFKVDPPALLEGIAPGQRVEFDLEKRGSDYVVTTLKRKK